MTKLTIEQHAALHAQQQPLPSIFDSKGNFITQSDDVIAGLSETMAAIYLRLADAARATVESENQIAATEKNITGKLVADLHAITDYRDENFPPLTGHDLWLATVKRI